MKILCIIGSNNKYSCTHEIMKRIFDEVNKLDCNMEFSYVNLFDSNVLMCRGCSICFNTGECILDKADEMPAIREKIDHSDFIVWASPVYMSMVTGVMKNFIDRMSFCAHVLSFSGKLGAVYSIMRSSGGQETCNYLKTVQGSLGCKTITEQTINIFDLNDSSLKNLSKKFLDAIYWNYDLSTPLLEQQFRKIKNAFIDSNNDLYPFESTYWNDEKYKSCDSFQKYTQIKRENMKGHKNE